MNLEPSGKCTLSATAVLFSAAIIWAFFLSPPTLATRLSPELSRTALETFHGGSIRLDGSIATAGGQLYLPLMPPSALAKKARSGVESALPDIAKPDIVLYGNGWAHVRVLKKGDACTLAILGEQGEKVRKRLLPLKFPSDLIVPEGFVLPKSWSQLASNLAIACLDDATIDSADFGSKPKAGQTKTYTGAGTIFLTSVTAGAITMLDGKNFNKLAEFPTEGTPCSMEFTGNKLFIADEGKNRVLILDPVGRKFLGQIDLAARTAPKGIVALPNGKWLYVSESAAGDIAVIETESGKVLLKTKVKSGPGRMAITPDGTFLIVLNVTAGELTVISTYNQKVVGCARVGDMPTALALSPDGKTAYVANRMSQSVSVVDIGKCQVTGTMKTGVSPSGIAVSPDGSKLYVAIGRENSISVFDTRALTKLHEVHLPSDMDFPGALCLLPDGHKLVITSQQTDLVGVLDVDKLEFVKQTPLGHATHEAVWVPAP